MNILNENRTLGERARHKDWCQRGQSLVHRGAGRWVPASSWCSLPQHSPALTLHSWPLIIDDSKNTYSNGIPLPLEVHDYGLPSLQDIDPGMCTWVCVCAWEGQRGATHLHWCNFIHRLLLFFCYPVTPSSAPSTRHISPCHKAFAHVKNSQTCSDHIRLITAT